MSVRALLRTPLRMGWTFIDQGLSSLTTLILSVLVARSVDASSFGFFTLLYSIYFVVVGMSRSIASDPLLIRYPGRATGVLRQGCQESAGAALTAGVLTGVLGLMAVPLLSGDRRLAVLALALSLPALLAKDAWRYCFFALGTPFQAVVNDALWSVSQLIGVAWLAATGHHHLAELIAVWGASAAVCVVIGAWQCRAVPRPDLAVRWLRRHRDLAPRYATEFLVEGGLQQATLWFAGFLGGLVAPAALRASEILLGPTRVLMQAAPAAVVPEGARSGLYSPERLLPVVRRASLALICAVLAWSLLLSGLLSRFGEQLLGQTWAYTRPLLLPVTISFVAMAAATGPSIGLRILAAARLSLRVRMLVAPLTMALAVIGVLVHGALGAAVGSAVGNVIGTAIWWLGLRHELRRRDGGAWTGRAGEMLGWAARHPHTSPSIGDEESTVARPPAGKH